MMAFAYLALQSFYLKHYRKKRREVAGPSMLGSDNEYSFGAFVETRDTIRKSSKTSPKSSTESSSSSSDKSPRYELRRRKNNANEAERVYTSRSFHKEAVYRSHKWGQRFKAMNGAGPSSNLRYFHSKEGPRWPPVRQNMSSYDSGFPEDERTNFVREMRHSLFSLPAARENHCNEPPAYRRYDSQDNEITMKSCSKLRSKRRSSNIPRADDSSDDEVFPKMRNHFTYEDSSGDDLVFHTYTPQCRRRRNRSKPRYPVAVDASYGHSKGHRRQIYQAIANYQATTDGTIDLYEGDMVRVIRKSKGGWWLVEIHDEHGWAPSNYLQPITSGYGE